jgi:hypothetical protein
VRPACAPGDGVDPLVALPSEQAFEQFQSSMHARLLPLAAAKLAVLAGMSNRESESR